MHGLWILIGKRYEKNGKRKLKEKERNRKDNEKENERKG